MAHSTDTDTDTDDTGSDVRTDLDRRAVLEHIVTTRRRRRRRRRRHRRRQRRLTDSRLRIRQ